MDIRTVYCPVCDKHMYVETDVSTTHCPICNHHLNAHHLDKPVEDYFTVVFDYSPFDMATMIVTRDNGDKIEVVNNLIGDEALLMYKKLMNIRGNEIEPCKECVDWKYTRLWIGYKFCPYCGRKLDT